MLKRCLNFTVGKMEGWLQLPGRECSNFLTWVSASCRLCGRRVSAPPPEPAHLFVGMLMGDVTTSRCGSWACSDRMTEAAKPAPEGTMSGHIKRHRERLFNTSCLWERKGDFLLTFNCSHSRCKSLKSPRISDGVSSYSNQTSLIESCSDFFSLQSLYGWFISLNFY